MLLQKHGRNITPVLLMSCLLFLFGCGLRSEETNFYLLNSKENVPVEQLAALAKKENMPKLQLRRVDIPGYLDRNALVTRADDGVRLSLAPFDSWAEPLGVGSQRLISNVLTPLLLEKGILLQPLDDTEIGPKQLFVQIERFDGSLNGNVVLEARWTLRNSRDKTISRGAFSDQHMAGSTYTSLVQAHSALLKKFATNMATPLAEAMKP